MRKIIFIATFSLLAQSAAAQITFTNLGNTVTTGVVNPDIASVNDQTSYSNTSWTPPTSGLIIVFVVGKKSAGAATPTTPTMNGNSLTWTQIGTTLGCGSRNGISLFGANASGSSTGATTVDFGTTTQTSCMAFFMQASSIDLSGGVAAAFVQSQTNTGTATSLSITLNAAGNSNNRPVAGFWKLGTSTTDPRTNWTEFDEFLFGEPTSLETQVRSDAFETTASASWIGSLDCCGIAAEIKAAAAGASTARVIIINQ